MSEHAKLSPSGASIWTKCPASIRLSEGIEDTPNPASERGTRIHMTAEELIKNQALTYPEHAEDAMPYVAFIKQEAEKFDRVMVEYRLEGFRQFVSDCWGTADFVAIKGTHGMLVDLKTGRQFVSVEGNLQLAIYATAAALEFDLQTVEVVIFQNGQVSRATLGFDDFRNTIKTVIAANQAVNTPATAGDHCKWCKARSVCRARAIATLDVPGSDRVTDDELDLVLPHARRLADWAADIEERAYKAAMEGQRINGYKLVEGTSKRKWKGGAEEIVREHGLADQLFTSQLVSITAAEKILGKRAAAEFMGLATEKPEAKPVLVESTDPRQPIATTINTEF
jgi:hypothetical protein